MKTWNCCDFHWPLYRIAQDDYKTYLKGIHDNSDLVTGTLEEMASELQRKFEVLVTDDKDIYEKACKGTYLSFIFQANVYNYGFVWEMSCFEVK